MMRPEPTFANEESNTASTDDERRKHERAEISAIAVVLARHNPGVQMRIDSLSVGGARLSGPATFAKAERLQILFDIGGTLIDVTAEVVRVEHQDIDNDRIAVRFIALAPQHRSVIGRFVQHMLDLEDELTPLTDGAVEPTSGRG